MRHAFFFFLLYGGLIMGFSTQINSIVDNGVCATQESTIDNDSVKTVVIDDYIKLESSSNDLLDDDDDDKNKFVTIVGNGLRLYSKNDYRNTHGCLMRHSGWWSLLDYCYARLKRVDANNSKKAKMNNRDKLKGHKVIYIPVVYEFVQTFEKVVGIVFNAALLTVLLTILAILSFGAFLLFGSKPAKKEEELELESVEFDSALEAIDFLQSKDDEIISYVDPDEGYTQEQITLLNECDDLKREILDSRGRYLRLLRVLCIGFIISSVLPSSIGSLAMSFAPKMFKGKDAKKATYKKRKVLKSIEALKKKIHLAGGYQVFPTMTVIGESHGSWNTHTLRGSSKKKKARAPKVSLETSGRWNAFVVQALSIINVRRKSLNLKEFEVKIDDFIFTEFRNGARTEQITKAMLTKGYVPLGPGLFVKLEHKGTDYAEYLLTVCETAKDMRSYGRSYSTSPVIDWISPEIPVHFVEMANLGLASDGPSYLTQGLSGIKAIAFQARFVNAPRDMWTFAQMCFGLCKGLFIQAKIVLNVTTGEAQFVSRDLLDQIEKQAESKNLSFFSEDCPVIECNGTKYQAGFFMDTANMAKGPMKKMATQLADGKKVTTLEGSNFMAFMIAEQFIGRTSMGWQTIQLIHTTILEKHREALKSKVSKKLERYLNTPYEKTLYEHMTTSFRKMKGMAEANIKAIDLLKSLSGKSTSRLIFGAGLSGTSDYVLELEGLPKGYAIHNPPKKVVVKYNHDNGKLARKMMSRYPQQGFESLLYLKVVTATQLGMLYDWVFEPKKNKDLVKKNTELMLFWEDMIKQNGDIDKAKRCLEGIKACLPFVKVGCSIISHYDQFLRLRGDSDGDKNFWSYDTTLVAIVEAIENATKDMRLPRLEIQGSGVEIDDFFDNKSYLSLCKGAIEGKNIDRYLKVANLLCANNNGQGPVGLIANLSTIPLSRLPWEINDQDKLVWGNEKTEKWFPYLLLMQQTAMDMQKRIYPAPSLIRWTVAKLFKTSLSDNDALTAPKSSKDTEGDYMSLAQDETVWSMSTNYSMEINCYEDGFMYNERCLSHWAAWVLNSIIFNVDFLTKKVSINGKQVLLASVASRALAEKGVEDFYKVISDNTQLSLEEVQENWVMTEDLITWKRNANLKEVVGKPSGGIEWIWNLVIDEYSKLKSKYRLDGETPLQHLANACTNKMHDIAKGNGVTSSYPIDGSNISFKLVMTNRDFIRLYSVFAKITDKNRKDISESEYMQGDLPKSASEMKQMFREMLDCDFLKDLGGLQGYFEEKGKKLPLNRMFNMLFSNEYTWHPNKRKCVTQALYRVLEANICSLAQKGGSRGTAGAIKVLNKLISEGVISKDGFSKECPSGKNKESWEKFLDTNEQKINQINEIWVSEENKTFRQAIRKYGLPTILDGGELGIIISGKGYPQASKAVFSNYEATLRFVELIANGNKNQRQLDVAEWVSDTVWPLAELCYMLADNAQIRGTFIGETLFDTQQNPVKVSAITAYSQGKITEVIDNQINLHNMICEAVEDLFPYSGGIATRRLLYSMIEAEKDSIEELFNYNDEDLQLVLDTVGTSRFQRKLIAKLKPLVGAARAKSYYAKWYDWGCNDGTPNNAKKAGYVAQRTFNSLFNITYLKDDEGYVRDGRGNLMVQSQWLKASMDFIIPEKFSGDLYHTFLRSDFSAAGMYILCQESRANGKFSVGRWVYFDTLTYTLAMNNSGKKKKDLFQKLYLMAHMSGKTPLSLGHAFHASHYNNVLKWCDQLAADQTKISIDFLPNMSGQQLKDMIVASKKFLVSYRFGYETKNNNKIIEVMLPFAFGANNKLASVTDINKWYLSSKLWMSLASVGQMTPGEGQEIFKANLNRFRTLWGVDYPVKSNKDNGHSSLQDGGTETSVEVKTVLPWFNQEAYPSVEWRKAARNIFTAYSFKEYENKALQGMPHPANAIKRFVEFFYEDEHQVLDKTKYSINKAVLGLMGLSSIEYQFDNLRKDFKSDFTKPIAKSWSNTAVSGIRDLFGGLGESSGWSVKNSWYVGPGRPIEINNLQILLYSFWPSITDNVETSDNMKIMKDFNPLQTDGNEKKKRRNESSDDSIEIKCN